MTSTGSTRGDRVGLVAALLVFIVYGSLALGTHVPTSVGGFYSDNATYYLMGHSLAADGDLEYRREDLERAFREYPSGPSGIFLKRGVDVQGVRLTMRPPFVEFPGGPDPDASRLYFGKSFAYPLAATPFVRLFGTNGFLLLNALLLAAAFWAVYTFTAARSGRQVALLWAGAFVFASVVPVFAVWTAPELFNWSLAVLAYFFWLHKTTESTEALPASSRLRGAWTDVVAAVLVGWLTYSKVTNILLFAPMAAWWIWKRQWRPLLIGSVACVLVASAAFGINVAVTGEWNYQGGDRATCYGRYPFQQPDLGFDVCDTRGRDEALGDVIFDRDVFWTNLRANLGYFIVGRNSGLAVYYFPAIFGTAALLAAWRRGASWQWFVLGGIVAQSLLFIVALPYWYFGGGGTVGNRYFISVYAAAAFLLPVVRSTAWMFVPWIVGSLFVARLILSPFQASIRPADHAKGGPFRLLPVELTNLNDLPLMTEDARVRIWYGDTGLGNPGFQIYYLDDNAYLQEADRLSFWTRGESTAEFLVKTDEPYTQLRVTLTAGPIATTARLRFAGQVHERRLEAGQSTIIQLALGPGFPYKKDRLTPAYVWTLDVASSTGFVPAITDGSGDRRFLGVRVLPIIVK